MVQKILLTIEIDDAQLDAAQAKVDKLIATLERAKQLKCELAAIDEFNLKVDFDPETAFDDDERYWR